MSCELTQHYVPGYLDGELDLVRTIAMETHFKSCPACARELESQQALHAALQGSSRAFAAPAGLRDRILSSLRTSSGVEVQERKIKWPSLNIWQWAGAFGVLALFSISGWQLTNHLRAPS